MKATLCELSKPDVDYTSLRPVNNTLFYGGRIGEQKRLVERCKNGMQFFDKYHLTPETIEYLKQPNFEIMAVASPRKLQKQPIPQFPSLLLRHPDDVRHHTPVRFDCHLEQKRPWNFDHSRNMPRFRSPRIQQHVSNQCPDGTSQSIQRHFPVGEPSLRHGLLHPGRSGDEHILQRRC